MAQQIVDVVKCPVCGLFVRLIEETERLTAPAPLHKVERGVDGCAKLIASSLLYNQRCPGSYCVGYVLAVDYPYTGGE